MADRPVRVVVVSRNRVVRAGIISLVAQSRELAIVTQAETVDDELEAHDVAIYDLGAVQDPDDAKDLRRLLEAGTMVVGLVYDTRTDAPSGVTSSLAAQTPDVLTLAASPEQLERILSQARCAQQPDTDRRRTYPRDLTERELQVLALIGAGLRNDAITHRLYLSINSVKTYIRSAYRKIGATNRGQAVRWAINHGLASHQISDRANGFEHEVGDETDTGLPGGSGDVGGGL